MFDINAKKERNKPKKNYEIVLSSMHGAPRADNVPFFYRFFLGERPLLPMTEWFF